MNSLVQSKIVELLVSYRANTDARDDDLGETWSNFLEAYNELQRVVGRYIETEENDMN